MAFVFCVGKWVQTWYPLKILIFFQVGKTRKTKNESPTWKVIKKQLLQTPNCDWFTNVYIHILTRTHLSGVFMGDISIREREKEVYIYIYIRCTAAIDCPPRHLFRAFAEKNILQKEIFIKLCQCLWREDMSIPVKWIVVGNWWWVKRSNNRCSASWVPTEGSDKGIEMGYYLKSRTMIQRDLELTTPRFLSAHLTSRDCEKGHSQWYHNLMNAVSHLSSNQTPGYLLYIRVIILSRYIWGV